VLKEFTDSLSVSFSECDDFEDCDVTTHEYDVIESRDVIDSVTIRRVIGTFL